jgi:hypothetical protein
MQAQPNLDGTGLVAICVECPNAPVIPIREATDAPASPSVPADAPSRFRGLLAKAGDVPPPGTIPDSLLGELPEEARRLLTPTPKSQAPTAPRPAGLREEDRRSLLDQGLVVSEDARGIRITGLPVSGRGPGTGRLSPTDIVRLAADLDGGVPPPEKRIRCPKCDAVLPEGLHRCTWCGQALPPARPASPAG